VLNAMSQPVWQAGEPINVNVDFDVPAFGALDEVTALRRATAAERSSLRGKASDGAHFISIDSQSDRAKAATAKLVYVPSTDELEGMLKSLKETCGKSCVKVLAAAMDAPGVRNETDEAQKWATALVVLADAALDQVHDADRLHLSLKQDASSTASLKSGVRARLSDTACTTTASCKLKSLLANKCNFGRVALQSTYKGLNVAVHTLGAVTSLLCGCINAGPTSTCALQVVPSMCVFPYNVYSKSWAATIQAWEAVKRSTKTCSMHGDSRISS